MFIFFCYVQVGGGPGLAFITFCDAFLQMPVAPLWSSLFFIMMILLGIDSEFGTLEGVIAPFYDMKWTKMRKELFTGIFFFNNKLCNYLKIQFFKPLRYITFEIRNWDTSHFMFEF